MRKAPQFIATLFLIITLGRVADFVSNGLGDGGNGPFFSAALAVGVYVVSFFTRWKISRNAARVGIIAFIGVDLLFNLMELTRTLSAKNMIVEGSNFLGMERATLETLMQISALIYGAFPTLAIGIMGWLQSGADKIDELNQFGKTWTKTLQSIGRIFNGIGVAIAVKIETAALFVAKAASVSPGNMPANDGQNGQEVATRSWKSLTAEDVARIPAMSRAEIRAAFGVSDGTAGNWKSDVLDGKRPWDRKKALL